MQLSIDRQLGETERGALVIVCGGVEPEKSITRELSSWLRYQWSIGRTVGGVCTGAYALAAAGLLENVVFTLHWENLLAFKELHPRLAPVDQLYALNGRIMTCGGGIASTDMMLKVIQENYGSDLARMTLRMCLHGDARNGDTPQTAPKAASLGFRHQKLVDIVEMIEERISDDINLDEIARKVQLSRRQIERLFQRYLGMPPKQYLAELRLQRGRELLAGTNMRVVEVAAACGFDSSSHFSKRFRTKFGVTPHRFALGL